MAVNCETRLITGINWQVYPDQERKDPDPYFELKSIGQDLFLKATGIDTRTSPIEIPPGFDQDPNALANLIIRKSQDNTVDRSPKDILYKIFVGVSPQVIIINMNEAKLLEKHDPHEVMRQIAEFQTSPDPSVLLSILGVNVITT